MALDYELEIKTDIIPRRAMDMIAQSVSGLSWSEDGVWLFDSAVTVSAIEEPEPMKRAVEIGFDFTPTISVGFRLHKEGDQDRFRDVLLRATLLLLEHAEDAVLLFNGEFVILQRLRGQLAFNADSGLWRDEDWLRRSVATPFELRSLPSPYL